MDCARKASNSCGNNRESTITCSPEPKKESRLTSIIDQLLSNKAKDSSRLEENGGYKVNNTSSNCDHRKTDEDADKLEDPKTQEISESSSARGSSPGERQQQQQQHYHQYQHQHHQSSGLPQARVGLVTRSSSSPEGGASREIQGQQPTSSLGARSATLRQLPTSSQRAMPTDALATSSTLETNNTASAASGTSSAGPTAAANPLKSEGVSPEPESSSPSVSPHSPSPARGFPLIVPGFGLAGLGLARPGGLTAPFSPPPTLERFSPANLAGGAPAIKQMEMMTRNYSDFMRSLAAKYNQNNSTQETYPMSQSNGLRCFDGSFPYKSGSPFLVRNMDIEGSGAGLGSGMSRTKLDSQNSPTAVDSRNTNTGNSASMTGGINCGVSDFSSSQTLLNLVRTASAQSASQLENYLKGAVKRTADGENRLDPLDLSVAHSKRPKLDPVSSGRDFRELLQEAEMAGSGESTSNLRSASASSGKPSWMTLLDRRMHSSPTSSRTSKNLNSTDKQQLQQRCLSVCTEKSCSTQSDASDVSQWTVDDVVKFVTSVDSCQEYAEKFREQSIDGYTLPLLTEEHLTLYMGLKLGPALKLRTTLARRIGHCAVCMHCIHCHGDESTEVRRRDSSRSPSVSK